MSTPNKRNTSQAHTVSKTKVRAVHMVGYMVKLTVCVCVSVCVSVPAQRLQCDENQRRGGAGKPRNALRKNYTI